MWERTLKDLIRGLRANKQDEAKFIALAIDEIRREVKTKDMELKAAAILKLTYLEMLGYDMSWASFNVVEIMSSSRHHLKAVGYLGAVQSFNQDTDVLMLTTNLLKKDLTSNPADIAVTLNGLAHIATHDLGRDLSHELITMLTHSRPNIRKRAILALYKVLSKYPDAAITGLPRLKDRLQDSDPGVVAATVNVICELARQKPEEFLPLAPQLFLLLTTSTNNWMLIKIIKLFGSLCPHEPRLVKKLFGPISDLISTTPAISLLYECVHTAIIGGMLQGSSGYPLARTCIAKLAGFIEDQDQNLKYIALLAMVKIVPSHPHLIAEYQDTILASIQDDDISIRMRALDLVSAMANSDNLKSLIQQLLSYLVTTRRGATLLSATDSLHRNGSSAGGPALHPALESASYRLVLTQRILEICSQSTYDNVTDFDWYLSVLVDLAYVGDVNVGAKIRDQLVDVVGRVKAARRYAVQLMVKLLSDESFVPDADGEGGSCSEVLWAAAWICGEYCGELVEPQKLLEYLLQPSVTNLPPQTAAVYIHAASKISGFWMAELAINWDESNLPEVKKVVQNVIEHVGKLTTSQHIEVQERAANTLQLFTFINKDLTSHRPRTEGFAEPEASGFDPISSAEPKFPKSLYLLQPLFTGYELNPVAKNAQSSVPIPEGLDLNAWIVPSQEDKPESVVHEDTASKSRKGKSREVNGGKVKSGKKKHRDVEAEANHIPEVVQPTAEEIREREQRKAERLERLRDDPYYIQDPQPSKPPSYDVDSIPVVHLDLPPLSQGKKVRILPALREPLAQPVVQTFVVERDGEMPRVQTRPAPSSNPTDTSTHNSVLSTDAPDAIKVVRKKKASGTGKKKKTDKPPDAP